MKMNNLGLKLKLKKSNQAIKNTVERIKTQNAPLSINQSKQTSNYKKLIKISLVSKILKTENNQCQKPIIEDRRNRQTKNLLKILPKDKKQLSNTLKVKLKSIKTQYYQQKMHPIILNNKKYHKEVSFINNKREILSYQKHDKHKLQWNYSKDVKTQTDKDQTGGESHKGKHNLKINLAKEQLSPFKINIKREWAPQERYVLQQQAGSGTFGVVHKARDRHSMQTVAIKKVFQDKNYKNRQLDIMKILNHPNIIKMKDSYYTYSKQGQYLNIVMDYYPINLSEYIYKEKKNKDQTFWLKYKVLTFYMLKALLYLEIHKIAHRDLKPHNILLDTNTFSLILCDFGSAKIINPSQNNLAYICSRSYRAPQLILGNTKYSTPVDMWSIGCILVEMIRGQTLFKAKNNIDQLVQIIKILGNPKIDQIRQMNSQCQAQKFKIPKIKGSGLQKLLENFTNDAQLLDLLKKMLTYSPKSRLSPMDGLRHNYFNSFRQQSTYNRVSQLTAQRLLDFNWLDNFPSYDKDSLIPLWYQK